MFSRTESFSQYIRLYPVVTFFLTLNILIYLVTLIPVIGTQVLYTGVGVNFLISEGEWWRLLTPMFLHGGIMHLLFNMFSLFIFGPELEKIAGKARFLTIYCSRVSSLISQRFSYKPLTIKVSAQVVQFSGFSEHSEHLSIIRSISYRS